MVTAKEKIQNPIYQELSGLVLTTEKLRKKHMSANRKICAVFASIFFVSC